MRRLVKKNWSTEIVCSSIHWFDFLCIALYSVKWNDCRFKQKLFSSSEIWVLLMSIMRERVLWLSSIDDFNFWKFSQFSYMKIFSDYIDFNLEFEDCDYRSFWFCIFMLRFFIVDEFLMIVHCLIWLSQNFETKFMIDFVMSCQDRQAR